MFWRIDAVHLHKTVLMKPFLRQVADHYYDSGNIGSMSFIFPNRRSMVFFRKYLAEAVAADGVRPLVAPRMMTINDLFYRLGGASASDRVRLLLELYGCYRELNDKAEPLDDFIFWGDVILGDFNDLDKYLVDPARLFTNIADLKEMQDDFSYLTETQKQAINAFIKHFKDDSGKLTVNLDTDDPDVKGRFLHIWNLLYPLYLRFNETLAEKGMSYEGMVYRRLAERFKSSDAEKILDDSFQPGISLVFVGLNALNECEKTVLRKLRDTGRAQFCWDWSGDMIRDPQNRSSFFMSDNIKEFGQAAQWDQEGLGVPEIRVVNVSSSVGQAKRLPDILKQIADSQTGGDMSKVGKLGNDDGTDCAVVLPDESLLKSVLNSIPQEIADINVTMGLPINVSELYVFMSELASAQMHMMFRGGMWHFYHKQVWSIFSNGLFRKAADDDVMNLVSTVKAGAKYYIPVDDLTGTPLTDLIFRPVLKDSGLASKEQIDAFAEYQKEVIRYVAPKLAGDTDMALELEYAKEFYRCVNMLQQISLEVLPTTYVRLLGQLMGSVSVPFRGEPLKGLQIMGPLETRALDFRNLVIMSANEGVFPRRNVSSSFIPPELRKGFDMPTYEYQDAVWAYYFYRMISRAENVWMLTDSRTEGFRSGEESRYIKQLEYHFRLPLKRYVVRHDGMRPSVISDITKTEEDVSVIRSSVLSATAIQNYLACPAKFHYSLVKGLKAEDEVAESLDYGMFGTVYHDVMRAVYTSEEAMDKDFFFERGSEREMRPDGRLATVSRDYIRMWLGREADIKKKVNALILKQLNAMDISGRNLVVSDVIVRYVMKTLQRDLELLEESGRDSFDVIGREVRVEGSFNGQRIKGFIDRMDSFSPDSVRIVDYKTGKVLKDDEDIHDGNAEAIADKIFAPDVKDRPKIALQFFIYDYLVRSLPETAGRRMYNSVYSTSQLFRKAPETVPFNETFFNAMTERLGKLLEEMCDTDVPFRRTSDANICSYCDFKTICGR